MNFVHKHLKEDFLDILIYIHIYSHGFKIMVVKSISRF